MNRLQMNFYTVYPTVEASYYPILIDLRWAKRLLENCDFIKSLKSKKKERYQEVKIQQYFDFLRLSEQKKKTSHPKINIQKLEKELPLIHRQAAPDAQIFWQNPISHEDERLWLATERFFGFFLLIILVLLVICF
jgi:hypothetical protein